MLNDICLFLREKDVSFHLEGDYNFNIKTFSSIYKPQNNSISWIRDIRTVNLELVNSVDNILIFVSEHYEVLNKNIGQIIVDKPYEVYFSVIEKVFMKRTLYKGTNSIIKTKKIGHNFSYGNNVSIGKDVTIGNNVTIGDLVSIVSNVTIGNNVIIQSGVKIGEEGYGFYTNLDNEEKRVPHLGSIIINDQVEIGANSCIVLAGLGETIIGKNVKIDNLCHIAHNVIIGDNTKITAMTMIAGSAEIGKDCWVAPGCNIMNQIKIGDECFLGMGAVVTKDIPNNSLAVGVPAKVIKEYTPFKNR